MKTKTTLLFGGLALGAYLLLRKYNNKGIGAVERVRRRIYKEVSLAQQAGIDFSQQYADLSRSDSKQLNRLGQEAGWKQSKRSIETGKPYAEAYFNSLRRAWKAVSGIQGIGATDYPVYDRDGNVCLTWTDVTEHIEHEPEAKVLLALPPHVEQKKKKKSKVSDEEEYAHRFQFAKIVWQEYRKQNPYFNDNIPDGAPDVIKPFKHKHAIVADAYARNKMRVRGTRDRGTVVEVVVPELGKDWVIAGSFDDHMVQYAQAILDAENKRNTDEGFAREDLDDIRRALLDKAQLMEVELPYVIFDKNRDILPDGVAKGEARYEFLPYINWIVYVHQSYERGGDTFYPIRSFDTEFEAKTFKTSRYGNRTSVKILPVWDVPIEKITGIF